MYFCHQHPPSHTVLIHSLQMSKPSQYSLIHFIYQLFSFQLFLAPLDSKLCPFITLPPNFSNTSSQEHSLSFFQHFSYHMPLLRKTPLVQLLLHTVDTSYHLPAILYCLVQFSVLPKLDDLLYSVNSVYHIPSTSSICCHLRPQVLKKQSTSCNGSPFSLTCIRPTFAYPEHFITYLHSLSTFSFCKPYQTHSPDYTHNFSSEKSH